MWTLLLLSALVLASVQGQNRCITPNQQYGVCVLLSSCTSLRSLLNQPRAPGAVDYVLNFRCGAQDFIIYVCCPDQPNAQQQLVTKQRPLQQPQQRPQQLQPQQHPQQLQTQQRPQRRPQQQPQQRPQQGTLSTKNHPNLRLLPLDKCGYDDSDRITGGNATGLNEFAWMALLAYSKPGSSRTNFLCGGSLISKRYVITASHCINGKALGDYRIVAVRLGEWDQSTEKDCVKLVGVTWCADPPLDIDVEEAIPHPKYDPNNNDRFNDIALVRLVSDAPVKTDFISTICLPINQFARSNYIGERLTTAGWGKTEFGTYSSVKLKVVLPVADQPTCQNAYNVWKRRIVNTQICAGGAAGKDSCSGDSGGPLMSQEGQPPRGVLVGVVSYGPTSCGTEGFPGVYTFVAAFVDWILDTIKD